MAEMFKLPETEMILVESSNTTVADLPICCQNYQHDVGVLRNLVDIGYTMHNYFTKELKGPILLGLMYDGETLIWRNDEYRHYINYTEFVGNPQFENREYYFKLVTERGPDHRKIDIIPEDTTGYCLCQKNA
ncbi:unnamed protein product [Bursaphelenchus okinawaensis]|uniref:Uncharacterized protein n=1 Tax=Bursaphelenchus okinawaensis TaxID=465554 RepID=A0A811LPG0_9BILA|nr:unnamed protein product [Bursaphelenchus okinawaensis]CAG9127157.1 unnamed protein product [Bursaphelenchus okinawaensis]